MQDFISDSTSNEYFRKKSEVRKSAQRNSRRVRQLKIILPLVSVIIALFVIAMTFQFSLVPGFEVSSTSLSKDGLVLTEPKLSGNNEDNSYRVEATRAIQRILNPKIIDLESIKARIHRVDGESVIFTANKGIFDSENDFLTLNENIEIFWSSGYSAKLHIAEVDLKKGEFRSENETLIESTSSLLNAGKVEILEETKSLRFTDGVKMTINPSEVRNDQ